MDSLPPAMRMCAPPARMRSDGHRDRLEAGTAEAIDGDAGGGDGQAREQGGDARHVAAGLGFGHGAAEDDVFDVFLGNLGMAREQGADGGGGEVVGARVAEGAAVGLSDGRANAIDDDCFRHSGSSLTVAQEGFRVFGPDIPFRGAGMSRSGNGIVETACWPPPASRAGTGTRCMHSSQNDATRHPHAACPPGRRYGRSRRMRDRRPRRPLTFPLTIAT